MLTITTVVQNSVLSSAQSVVIIKQLAVQLRIRLLADLTGPKIGPHPVIDPGLPPIGSYFIRLPGLGGIIRVYTYIVITYIIISYGLIIIFIGLAHT